MFENTSKTLSKKMILFTFLIYKRVKSIVAVFINQVVLLLARFSITTPFMWEKEKFSNTSPSKCLLLSLIILFERPQNIFLLLLSTYGDNMYKSFFAK